MLGTAPGKGLILTPSFIFASPGFLPEGRLCLVRRRLVDQEVPWRAA